VACLLIESELPASRFVKIIHKIRADILKAEKVDEQTVSQAGSWMEPSLLNETFPPEGHQYFFLQKNAKYL
jgi:hypothetical protein